MQTREISNEQWQTFFNIFTAAHQDEHINVETIDKGRCVLRSCLRDLPLVGVVSSCPKSGRGDLIEVIAKDPSGARATHAITEPSKVQLGEEANGQPVALQIDSADGSITMIRFEPSRENMPEGFMLS